MNKARGIVLEILNKVLEDEGYSNIVLNAKLTSSDLSDLDKGLVTEIIYGTLKYKYTIDLILNSFIEKGLIRVDKRIVNILRSAVYQMKYLDKVPDFAVVNEAVELTKKVSSIPSSKFVNGVLRNFIRNDKDAKVIPSDENLKLCYDYSFEPWMVKLFMNNYGKDKVVDILAGLNERPALTVRVNQLKGEYDAVLEELKKQGYDAEEGFIAPDAIRIVNGKSIEDNQLFKDGFITVQDESAMLTATTFSPKENDVLLDLCSAPGGKTTHLAELTLDKAEIRAFDIHENKLEFIKENLKRLGITSVKLAVMDATKLNEELKDSADGVLIDVPCSGLGIIRKKPEIKFKKDGKNMENLIKIQREIMRNAATYVKCGGTLIYSTCTLNKKENDYNIKWFLEKNKNYKLEKLFFGDAENIIYDERGYVTILPNKYMDGFFIAKLRREE